MWQLVVAALAGYLIGSFPTGLVIGRLYGVDPRTVGSGRTGGTNVYRAAGPVAGISTALLDFFKGAIAILIVRAFISDAPLADALTGLGAVAGHNWSLYLRFKGGAGTMTNAGTVLLLYWPATIFGGLLGFLVLRLVRISSVASMVFAIVVPLIFAFAIATQRIPAATMVYGIGQLVFVLWSLRPNIEALLRGDERRIGQQGQANR